MPLGNDVENKLSAGRALGGVLNDFVWELFYPSSLGQHQAELVLVIATEIPGQLMTVGGPKAQVCKLHFILRSHSSKNVSTIASAVALRFW